MSWWVLPYSTNVIIITYYHFFISYSNAYTWTSYSGFYPIVQEANKVSKPEAKLLVSNLNTFDWFLQFKVSVVSTSWAPCTRLALLIFILSPNKSIRTSDKTSLCLYYTGSPIWRTCWNTPIRQEQNTSLRHITMHGLLCDCNKLDA